MTIELAEVCEAARRVAALSTNMEWITSNGTVYSRHLNPSILPAVREELQYMEEQNENNP